MRMRPAVTGGWDRTAQQFVTLQVCFNGVTAILSLFVNTFLLKAYGSFSAEVLLYNAVMALVQPAAMLTGLKLTACRDALFTQRAGFVFYGLALAVLCVFGEAVSFLYPLFAAMISFGAGYYYAIYSVQMLCYTNDGNRDAIAGLVGVIGAVVSILLPLLSGYLITVLDAFTGYRIVFGAAALLAVAALAVTVRLPALPRQQSEPALRRVIRVILGNRNGRLIMVANGLSNCCSFTVPIYVTLVFYNLVENEMLISINSAVGSVMGILGAGLYGVVVNQRNRVRSSLLAAVAVMLPCLGMLFGINVFVIMVFQAVYSLFTQFLGTPILNEHFKVMESLGLRGDVGAEVHLLRELFVSGGRLLGLALVWVVPQTNAGAVVILVTMMATVVVNAWILHRIETTHPSCA